MLVFIFEGGGVVCVDNPSLPLPLSEKREKRSNMFVSIVLSI